MENKDLIMALESLEREKNISRADTIKTIEDALISALRKHFGRTALLTAKIDPEVGTIEAYQTLVVAEEVTNPEVEISLEDAKKENPKIKVGQELVITLHLMGDDGIVVELHGQLGG